MRRQFLYGAAVALAAASAAACVPYYGRGAGYYGYDPYGPPPGYGPYGAYPPPPPPPQYAPTAPAAVGPAVSQSSGPAVAYVEGCRKGLLWPFVREPGDCPTDAERFSGYPPLWFVR